MLAARVRISVIIVIMSLILVIRLVYVTATLLASANDILPPPEATKSVSMEEDPELLLILVTMACNVVLRVFKSVVASAIEFMVENALAEN